ncbi:acylphosphatase-like domain-containing protein [Caerostris darwini]|uniref:Acylphosphatase-like domain-containing protein n=2 Tax=Caerostris TaxID=172845 RepID=A0AAV4QE48_9ARAC|nr:acylphosphatase-like domain-containing protein [Caerostris extrusa]GIY06591.1 acylphosphatase-like domain-containing protein [Caerostris darwini]
MRGREIIVWRCPRRSWVDQESASWPVLVQVDFEVFGDLQGVNFIQYAKAVADRLGVRGWIKMSFYGTAMGQLQGDKDRVDEMALWLRHTGCPRSRINFVDFQNWRVTDGFEYRRFNARV